MTNATLSTGTAGETLTYSYTDQAWSDKLTAYNGQAITYDSIGNPTTYRGETLTWHGRLLMSYEKGSVKYAYTYNADGLRTSKTKYVYDVKKFEETYIWSGSKLISTQKKEISNNLSAQIVYLYDSNEDAFGFTYDGDTYIYAKNPQGDVSAIINATDNLACMGLTYDAWGKAEYVFNEDFESLALLEAIRVAAINSITYRGYFYDSEIDMYYLQSRYYDPEVGRFINADDTEMLKPTQPNKYSLFDSYTNANTFAYCDNNPVNKSDHNGKASKHNISDNILVDLVYAVIANEAISISHGRWNGAYYDLGLISVLFEKWLGEKTMFFEVIMKEQKNSGNYIFKLITKVALEKFKNEYYYIKKGESTKYYPNREFLFNDKCVEKEIKDHFIGFMWSKGFHGYFLPGYMTFYYMNVRRIEKKARTPIEIIYDACKAADIAEHSVIMNPNETKIYGYRNNIRDSYKKTNKDPYYDSNKKKRVNDVTDAWKGRCF